MYATGGGTGEFAGRFSHYRDFYVKFDDLYFSKLGFGTFKKEPYRDENYLFSFKEALKVAIRGGINVVDTAINYRYQESEKEIGAALEELFSEGRARREEIIVASKGGFIPLEFPFPKNPYEWIEENIIKSALAKACDIELDQHCMSLEFLRASCEKSLQNLGLESIDIYFLHNPETELKTLGQERFYEKIREIFALFEELVSEGKIRKYGICVWNALIYDESNDEHINLQRVYDAACEVGGEGHHFKYIQTPFNIAKTAAAVSKNQKMKDGSYLTLLQAAKSLKLGVIGSSSLLQMHLFQKSFKPEIGFLLDESMTLKSDIQLALQFVRSTRGVISSLFSSKESSHVRDNLEVAKIAAASVQKYNLLYRL
ncbi:MAG: aldo/keto reductase [Campylobacteraceae bacterium]|jgi:aryl-alcohol dehydrogenase-like predicted oxidoreductase|nr:aldo/keto reductase [Campylobacteraceae bacterium]